MMCTFDGGAGAAGAAIPGCVTVIVFPAARIVPVLLVVVPFALTVKLAVPDPEACPETVIHDALATASHEHPAWVVTVSVPVPPAATEVTLPGLTV
jgi:hypothetical protein